MNKYLDFESDIEILDGKINQLNINDNNFISEKNKLTEQEIKKTLKLGDGVDIKLGIRGNFKKLVDFLLFAIIKSSFNF